MAQVEPGPPKHKADASSIGDDVGYLIRQASLGSTVALGRLMEGCRKYLLLMADEALDSDLRPKGGASDLVQDTFLAAQQDFARFQGTTERELLAWLTKILTYRLANNVRRYRGTRKRDIDREVALDAGVDPADLNRSDTFANPMDVAVGCDEERRLQEALTRLPKHLRQVLALRTWERRSFAEIGFEMNKSAESARKLWGRAVRRLERELLQTS